MGNIPSVPVSNGLPSAAPAFDPMGMILGGGAGAATAILGAINAAKQRKFEAQQAAAARQFQTTQNDQGIAVSEANQDPFRQQMSQAGDIAKLDQMERAKFAPVHLGADPNYASHVLPMSGGFSYEKSPELISSAAALKRNVMGGHVAPSQTDPANAGKTAALNLLAISANGADPGAVSATGAAPANLDTYTAGMSRRPDDGTSISVTDATTALTRAFRSELGRDPKPGEIQSMLTGQGVRPGGPGNGQWVGSNSMNFLLNTLRSQGAASHATPSYTGVG